MHWDKGISTYFLLKKKQKQTKKKKQQKKNIIYDIKEEMGIGWTVQA